MAGQPVAVVSTVQVRRLSRRRQRLNVSGPVTLDAQAKAHLEYTVIPAVDLATEALALPRRCYELSVINLGAASVNDLGVQIEGFSLDAAAALGVLSAATRLPIRQDTVVTGHLASPAGDIRAVRSLPEKLEAAIAAGDVQHFLYPSLDEDQSLEILAASERTRIIAALTTASDKIRVHGVRDLTELVRRASTERGRLQASLKAGYFADRPTEDLPALAALLVEDLESCFWNALEGHLYGGQFREARSLMELRIRHQIRTQRYPQGFGAQLSALVASVPPPVRRRRGFFPVLPPSLCFEMGRLAAVNSEEDAAELLCAALGRSVSATPPPVRRASRSAEPPEGRTLNATLEAISAERLANEIGIPADEARAGFVLPGVIIQDYQVFLDTIIAFHVSLIRHVDGVPAAARPDEALSLLEHAYADIGGLAGARSEALFAVDGGMRRILDRMTEQFKVEQRFKRVHRVLKESLDPLDWDGRIEFMRGLLERLRLHLPGRWLDVPPERFVRRQDDLVRAYVEAMDRVQSLIRTL